LNVSEDHIIKRLQSAGLRKTQMRKEVLQLFLSSPGQALSNRELEDVLEDADRITLYRTLKTFEQSGVIHQAVDGSGITKYALCTDDCTTHAHHDHHAHFHCRQCERTICLEEVGSPRIKLPAGFEAEQIHLVVEGICDRCAAE
jgi:Fur family ferric uptake transcriptional regulator